jgi:4-carboxymuconolactone decarboxylase
MLVVEMANHGKDDSAMDRREAGQKIIREMMGEETAGRLLASAGSDTFGSAVAGYAIDQAFGEIWTRPGLDRKARSLVSMAVMIALRQPNEFAIHMNIALNNGLTLDEIEEALIQTLPYVGFPAVATALAAAGKVIQERGLDKDPAYGGHRGLL